MSKLYIKPFVLKVTDSQGQLSKTSNAEMSAGLLRASLCGVVVST